MTDELDAWIEHVCRHLGLDDVVDRDGVRDLTLDLARDVAHSVERAAAPVTTFLLGLAAGRCENPRQAATEVASAIRRLLEPHAPS